MPMLSDALLTWYQSCLATKLNIFSPRLSSLLLIKIWIKRKEKFMEFALEQSFIKLLKNTVKNFLNFLSKVSTNSWFLKIKKTRFKLFWSMWSLSSSENGLVFQQIREENSIAISLLCICWEMSKLRANSKLWRNPKLL